MTSLFNPTQQKKWSRSTLWLWTVGFQLHRPREVKLPLDLLPNKLRPHFLTAKEATKGC